jgi:hypothetical protein
LKALIKEHTKTFTAGFAVGFFTGAAIVSILALYIEFGGWVS